MAPDRPTTASAPDPEALARWLAAEREDSVQAAQGAAGAALSPGAPLAPLAPLAPDTALRELLSSLPPLAPSPGFATRVMARAARGPQPWWAAAPAPARRAARLWASPWLRAALLLCVTTGGFALLWVPVVLRTLGGFWSPAELLEKSIAALMSLHLWLASTFDVGQKLVLLCKAFSAPLASAPLAVAAGVCLLISAGALRGLRALIHSDRRWVDVDPI